MKRFTTFDGRGPFDELSEASQKVALAYIKRRNKADYADGVGTWESTQSEGILHDAQVLRWFPNGRLYTP